MNTLATATTAQAEAQTDVENFGQFISNQVKTFQAVPDQYRDLVPEVREKKIIEARKLQIDQLYKTLDKKALETKSKLKNLNADIQILTSPLRSSNSAAGQAQFQSAISVVQSKNKELILDELEKSVSSSQNDYTYSIYNLVAHSEFDQEFKIQVDDILRTHPDYNSFEKYNLAKESYSEILNMIDYQKRHLSSGTVNGYFSINKSMRAKKK